MGEKCADKKGAKKTVIKELSEKIKSSKKKCEKKITNIKIISLEFLSDHNMLKDNEADWKNTGALFTVPDWDVTKAEPNPISFSMTKRCKVKVTVEATPADAPPEEGGLAGYFKGGPLLFHEDSVTFTPNKKNEFITEAKELFGQVVEGAYLDFEWMAIAEKEITDWTNIGETHNLSFSTIGKPIVETRREDGVTYKRMEAAVKWVGEANSLEELEILDHLFNKFDRYVLSISTLDKADQNYLDTHPKLKQDLNKVGWPKYFNPDFGAWPAIEYEYWGAECQAICRLIQGIMRQVGSPADIELVYVSANYSNPEIPVEKTGGNRATGPNPKKRYVMVDAKVEVGKVYWPPKKGQQAPVGWNKFEAYVKYKKGPTTRYFGGGTGLLPVGTNPLHVFWGIAEYKWVKKRITIGSNKKTISGREVTGVHKYLVT
ncbi:MAG: hypothetical protein ACYS21_02460 [Planctomycetota bacterium]|jgi:hypothetical protein